jgi:hypothetical protein
MESWKVITFTWKIDKAKLVVDFMKTLMLMLFEKFHFVVTNWLVKAFINSPCSTNPNVIAEYKISKKIIIFFLFYKKYFREKTDFFDILCCQYWYIKLLLFPWISPWYLNEIWYVKVIRCMTLQCGDGFWRKWACWKGHLIDFQNLCITCFCLANPWHSTAKCLTPLSTTIFMEQFYLKFWTFFIQIGNISIKIDEIW